MVDVIKIVLLNDIKDKLKRCAVPLFVAVYYFLFKSKIK